MIMNTVITAVATSALLIAISNRVKPFTAAERGCRIGPQTRARDSSGRRHPRRGPIPRPQAWDGERWLLSGAGSVAIDERVPTVAHGLESALAMGSARTLVNQTFGLLWPDPRGSCSR